jgi:alanyl-tRNA synthetase
MCKEQTGATDFLGYDTETAEGVIQALAEDGKMLDSATAGDKVSSSSTRRRFMASPAARWATGHR